MVSTNWRSTLRVLRYFVCRSPERLPVSIRLHRHQRLGKLIVSARSLLGGLHHDYRLVAAMA